MVQIPLLSFKKIYNFANYLAITPPYHFQKCELTQSNFFKCYVIISGILSIIGESWSIYYRSEILTTFRTSLRVADFINELTLFGTYLVIKFDLCFLKTKNWEDLLNEIDHLDALLPSKFDTKSVKKFLTWQAILGHLLFFIFTAYQWVSFIGTGAVSFEIMGTYGIHYLSYYNIVYLVLLENTVLFIFEKKFKTLNTDFKKNLILSEKVIDASNTKFVDIIRQVGVIFRQLSHATDSFTNLFGYTIILKVTHLVITVIVMINVTFISSSFGPHPVENISATDIIASNILATCFTMGWTVLFVILCQRVINEAKNTVKLCYAFQAKSKSDEREELLKLAAMADAKIPDFSAAGYFKINRSTLISIFGTVTTYVIVLIQLNISMY